MPLPTGPPSFFPDLRRDILRALQAYSKKRKGASVSEESYHILKRSIQKELHLRTGLNGELLQDDLDRMVIDFLEFWQEEEDVELPGDTFDALGDSRKTFSDMLREFMNAKKKQEGN